MFTSEMTGARKLLQDRRYAVQTWSCFVYPCVPFTSHGNSATLLYVLHMFPPKEKQSKLQTLLQCVHKQLQRTPEAPVFVLGDFNHCRLEQVLHGFQQYVKSKTRKNRVLDKCFGNVKNAYRAKSLPPLANSDHNTVHLMPTYKTRLKASKPQKMTVL